MIIIPTLGAAALPNVILHRGRSTIEAQVATLTAGLLDLPIRTSRSGDAAARCRFAILAVRARVRGC